MVGRFFLLLSLVLVLIPDNAYAQLHSDYKDFNIREYSEKIDLEVKLTENSSLIPAGQTAERPEWIIALPDSLKPVMNISYSENEEEPGGYDCVINWTYIGKRRGVYLHKIELSPFKTHDSLNCSPAAIRLEVFYSKPAVLSESVDDNINNWYPDVINKKAIESFQQFKKLKSGKDRVQSEKFWYDNDVDYYRIETSRDGIARINISELPEDNLSGKNISGLKLLYLGYEVPIHVVDENGIIDNSDYILFRGKRPAGDTTWWSYFSRYEPFYLYYDKNSDGLRFNIYNEPSTPGFERDYVKSYIHFENETFYWGGIHYIFTQNIINEGWYWGDKIDALTSRDFKTDVMLTPVANSNPVELAMRVAMTDTTFTKTGFYIHKNNIEQLVNGDTIRNVGYENIASVTYRDTLANGIFFTGYNNVHIRYNDYEERKSGYALFDWIEASYKSLPYIKAGNNEFFVEKDINDFSIRFFGLSSPEIVIIDTLTNEIITKEGQPGYSIIAGGITNNQARSSIIIDSDTSVSEIPGFHFLYRKNPDDNAIYRIATTSGEAKKFLDSIGNVAVVAGIINGYIDINSDIKSWLSSKGASEINNFISGNSYAWYLSDGNFGEEISEKAVSIAEFIPDNDGRSYSFDLNFKSGRDYHVFVQSMIEIERPLITKVKKSTLTDTQDARAIIIYHEKFKKAAEYLAEIRETDGISCKLTDIDNIYKEFNYGKKSSETVRDYLRYCYNNQLVPPEFIVLFGDASWDPRKVSKGAVNEDYIPAWGFPVSDFYYTLLDGNDLEPDAMIGRIPVYNEQLASDYIDKIVSYENTPPRPWMKDFLYLSGGFNEQERDIFYNYNLSFSYDIYNSDLCADTSFIRKYSEDVGGDREAGVIKRAINNGTAWLNYVGHAAAEVFDMDGWHASTLNNTGRYGIFSTLACNSSAYGEPTIQSRNEEYMTEPLKGFVGSIGSSNVSNLDVDLAFFSYAMKSIFDPQIKGRYLGHIMNYGKSGLRGDYDWYRHGKYQFTLLADPMIRFKVDTTANPYIDKFDVKFLRENNQDGLVQSSDSIMIISGNIYNAGIKTNDYFELVIERSVGNDIFQDTVAFQGICRYADFEFRLPVKGLPGEHKIKLIIDPEQLLVDSDRDNNKLDISHQVYEPALTAFDPMPNWNVYQGRPVFRLINRIQSESDFSYDFYLTSINDSETKLYISTRDEIIVDENYIDWIPEYEFENNSGYNLFARLTDNISGVSSAYLTLPFYTDNEDIESGVKAVEGGKMGFRGSDFTGMQIEVSDHEYLTNEIIPQNFTILGLNGTQDLQPQKWVKMNIGENSIVNGPFHRGINIAAVSMFTGEVRYRRYDTWKTPDTISTMIKFIRDSISNNEYLALATCDNALYKIFSDDVISTTLLDSLKETFRMYGSKFIDSLDSTCSFVILSHRNAEEDKVFENYYPGTDTAAISGDIPFYTSDAKFTSKIFGPAKKWKYLTLDNEFTDYNSSCTITLAGIDYNGKETKIQEISGDTDLSGIDAGKYPFLKLLYQVNLIEFSDSFKINSLSFDFIPAVELILRDHYINFESPAIMRGDIEDFACKIVNISRRTVSEPGNIRGNILNDQGVLSTFDLNYPNIDINSSATITSEIETSNIDLINSLQLNVNNIRTENEFIYSNNIAVSKFYVYEDTTKPEIFLYADNYILEENGYTSIHPEMKIEIYDNSRLVIDDPNNIDIWIDGYRQNLASTTEWFFESFPVSAGLKCIIRFTPQDLDYTQHWIRIAASDASGNSDTLFRYFNVSLNGEIYGLSNYPNPFGEYLNIDFRVKGPEPGGQVVVDIYNSIGQLVRSIKQNMTIGRHEVIWDGFNGNGNRAAPGTYYYIIRLNGSIYADPKFGKAMFIR